MTNTNTTGCTVHGVLAGAYKASNPKSFLYHASTDGGASPVCKRVKADSLADEYATEPEVTAPTCEHCRRKLGL